MRHRLGILFPETRGSPGGTDLALGSIEPEIRGRLSVVEHHPFLLIATGVLNLVVRGVLVAFCRHVGVVRFCDVRLGIEFDVDAAIVGNRGGAKRRRGRKCEIRLRVLGLRHWCEGDRRIGDRAHGSHRFRDASSAGGGLEC